MTALNEEAAAAGLSAAEIVFIRRMLPHIEAGRSLEEAAAAVRADDERIWLACCHELREDGSAITGARGAIAATMAAAIYRRLRGAD